MADFDRYGIEHLGRRDDWYWGVSLETWAEWCYAALSEAPPYSQPTEVERGFDCDDFAYWFAAWSKCHHKANAIWEVWGYTPGGYHAWNVVETREGKYEIEPQNGEMWCFGSNPNYQVHKRL